MTKNMTKKLMIGAAIGALMVSGAVAQSPAYPSKDNASPPPAAQSQPAPDKAAPSQPAADKAAQNQPSGDKAAAFVPSQKPEQWLASNFKGTDVLGADNQKIGDVSDILFDKSGKIDAFVISVGGFLGMGAKEVALAPSAFDLVPGSNGAADKLKIAMSKDQLTQAQNFARYEPPRPAATTGTGSGPGASPGMKPSNTTPGMKPSSNTPPTGR